MKTQFSFTNKDFGTAVRAFNLGAKTNYGKIKDEPDEARMSNRTCTLDQGEIVTYRCRDINNIPSYLSTPYPARVLSGIEFGVRVDELLRTTSDEGVILQDEPIVATLSFKCPKSSTITPEVISEVFGRLIGAVYDNTASEFRWNDLMRSALVPDED